MTDTSELRMDAYYYGFTATGVPEIDLILSAVACAGKSYHHTDSWNDEAEWPPHEGKTPVDWIQNAGQKAATALEAKEAEIAALRAETATLRDMLLHPDPDQEPDNVRLHREKCDAIDRALVAEARAETAERKLEEARAALKAFLPDPTMMDILWGDMDDEATGTHTIKLKHFRAARAVTEKE